MLIIRAARALRPYIPRPIFSFFARMGIAVVTPFVFSLRTGHFRSALLLRAVDEQGLPRPWYTFPAIEFLECKDFTGRRVLEWGAGHSTFWWASRAAAVTSLESDPKWIKWLQEHGLPSNVSLHRVPQSTQEAEKYLSGKYDVIIVDGLERRICAEKSLPVLAEDGCILVDNSERFWGPEGQYPIMDLFRRHGFSRVDFYGFAPSVIRPYCTSLFFNGSCFLLAGHENPVCRIPAGRPSLPAPGDRSVK